MRCKALPAGLEAQKAKLRAEAELASCKTLASRRRRLGSPRVREHARRRQRGVLKASRRSLPAISCVGRCWLPAKPRCPRPTAAATLVLHTPAAPTPRGTATPENAVRRLDRAEPNY